MRKSSSNNNVTTADTTIEPRQPSLLEKKTNMAASVQARCREDRQRGQTPV
jgi:hypothetical protein